MPRKYKKKNSYKKYSESNFLLAIQYVDAGYSIRESSRRYDVPYSTLNAHVNHEVSHDRVGRPTIFNKEEEDNLEKAALLLQSWGVPLTIDEFINLSKQYALSLNKINLFRTGTSTYDWLYSFLNRHHNLILKKSYPLEKKRAALTNEQVDKWFQLLNKLIEENNLPNRPAQIFNADESGMSDNISYSKVIVHRHTSNAYRVQGGTGGRSYINVMFCGSATGFLLPPFVIYKSKRLFDEWCVGGPSDTGYDCAKKILKDEYSRTNFKNVGKPEFPSLLNQLWTNDPVGTKTNIIKSFMKAGVFPFNPNSIDRSRILKSKVDIDKNQSTVPTDTANNNNKVSRVQQSTTQAINNSFATSHQAIASLNRILEDTKSIGSSDEDPHDQTEDDDDNDDDDEYLPSKSNFHSPTSSSSNSQNDENTSLSTSKSPKTSQTKHQPQTTQNSSSKHLEKILQERKIKRLKSTVTAVDLETSQEDAPDTSTSNPPNSIQAITTAIQAIFVIDGSNGQVITEKIVIQQLEERKKQQNLKRPKSNNRTSQPKRQK
ncbi:unnamed protein product, partial [Rotaria magnacalcarata]